MLEKFNTIKENEAESTYKNLMWWHPKGRFKELFSFKNAISRATVSFM